MECRRQQNLRDAEEYMCPHGAETAEELEELLVIEPLDVRELKLRINADPFDDDMDPIGDDVDLVDVNEVLHRDRDNSGAWRGIGTLGLEPVESEECEEDPPEYEPIESELLEPKLVRAARREQFESQLARRQQELQAYQQDAATLMQVERFVRDGHYTDRLRHEINRLEGELEALARGFLSAQDRAHQLAPEIADDPRSRYGSEPTPKRQGTLS